MHAFALFALSASAISSVSATSLKPRTPTLCALGISLFGGCETSNTDTTSTTTSRRGSGACANGADPSSTYTTSNGDVYGVCSDTNFAQYDIKTTQTNSIKACADACSKTSGCVAATWDDDELTCYLKNHLPSGSSDTNYDSVYKISSGSSPTTTKSSTTSTTAKTTYVAAATPTCGVIGYDKGNPVASRSDFSGNYATFSACRTMCQGSLSFSVGGVGCVCYPGAVGDNVNYSSNSPYVFYDMGCTSPVSTAKSTLATMVKPTSTTSSTTTKAATTSSSSVHLNLTISSTTSKTTTKATTTAVSSTTKASTTVPTTTPKVVPTTKPALTTSAGACAPTATVTVTVTAKN